MDKRVQNVLFAYVKAQLLAELAALEAGASAEVDQQAARGPGQGAQEGAQEDTTQRNQIMTPHQEQGVKDAIAIILRLG